MPSLFLSHVQTEAGREAALFYAEAGKAPDTKCWLDIYAGDKSLVGMEAAVKECDVVIAFVTKSYLERKFCLLELAWAQKHGKKVQPVHLAPDKSNLGKFRDSCPDAFRWIFGINFLSVDITDMRMFEATLPIILRDAASSVIAPSLSGEPVAAVDAALQGKVTVANLSIDEPGTKYTPPSTKVRDYILTCGGVDGKFGKATTKALQQFLIENGFAQELAKCGGVDGGFGGGTKRLLQTFLVNAEFGQEIIANGGIDGSFGKSSTKALQSFLLTTAGKDVMLAAGGIDGSWGAGTTKALQTFLTS